MTIPRRAARRPPLASASADRAPAPGGRLISIVVPVLNEAPILTAMTASLLAQRLEGGDELELLVVDGGSQDGSVERLAAIAGADPRVRPMRNPSRTAPFAFNIGIAAARGEFVAILGGHCTYDPDYLAVCLRELEAHHAVGCSGRAITVAAGAGLGARLAGWALSHPFGVSGSSFRTQPEGYADSIPYAVYRREALEAAGGYDEAMIRNQDNDLNYRLRRAGHRLYCTWKTSCRYVARATIAGLMQYARANGYWCGISFRREPRSLGLRHYVPFFFLAAVAGAMLAGLGLLAAGRPTLALLAAASPLAAHLALGHLAAAQLARRERTAAPLLLPWVLLAFHLAYGAAFARGVLDPGASR